MAWLLGPDQSLIIPDAVDIHSLSTLTKSIKAGCWDLISPSKAMAACTVLLATVSANPGYHP
jgi:hypothetical protein